MEERESIEDDFNEINDKTPFIHNTQTYIKKRNLNKKIILSEAPHETSYNNKKKQKYFSNLNDEKVFKIALEKYESIQKKSNIINTNNNNYFLNKNNIKKKSNIQLNKDLIKYAEPRSTVKFSYKIQPKILDNNNESESEEESTSENCIQYKSKNDTQITRTTNQTLSKESINLNLKESNINLEEYDFKIDSNLLNFENFVFIDNLYMDLKKDLEINKMEIIQNKLSILKDFFEVFNNKNNIELFQVFENYSDNNIIQKCVKEFILLQYIYLFIFIIIIIFEENKEIYLSGIKNCAFYYSQNYLSFVLICLNKSQLTEEKKNDDNYNKIIKKLEENKTWLNNLNCKKIISNNNKISKQIMKNILNTIKDYYYNNENLKEKYPFIESNINLLNAYIKSLKKLKIKETINEIFQNQNIKELLENTINQSYLNKNNTENENEENKEEKPTPPYLKKINEKYKYTLVLDLDETLVHYVEDEESAYIQVRPGTEDFILDLSNYYEIVIFTAALKNYADIVIDSIDPNKKIIYRLYRNYTIKVGDINFKDLSKLGRDLKKVIIIDNNSANFGLQPKNGLKIKDFEGDENDEELDYLKEDLIQLYNYHPDDVRVYIPDIQKKMDKRSENNNDVCL